MSERELLRAIRLALGQRADVVLWRNSAGVATYKGRKVPYGLCDGAADLIGIRADGRFLALEVKGPRGRATVKQAQFLALVRNMGGIGAIVRSIADAEQAVEKQ